MTAPVPFDFQHDGVDMNVWRVAQGAEPLPPDLVPATALLVPGVACGFLVRTDGGFAMLEGFATNPAASPEARAEALAALIDALLARAARLGFTRVVVSTPHASLAARCREWPGARSAGLHEAFALDLR